MISVQKKGVDTWHLYYPPYLISFSHYRLDNKHPYRVILRKEWGKMVIRHCIYLYSLIQALSVVHVSTLYCSPVLPINVDSKNDTSGYVTNIDVHVTRDTSLCMVTRDGKVRAILRVVQSRVQFHVREKRVYTVPHVSVSCYCTCQPSKCQLPTCEMCYNVTLVSPPCDKSSSHSSTCCSVKGSLSLGLTFRI